MSTKYELATELRALTRGMKPLPICRMKKHELEAEIDRLKVVNAMKENMEEYPPAKPGPLGPRSIKVTETKTDDIAITVPEAPKKHVTESLKRKPTISRKEGVMLSFDDTPANTIQLISEPTVSARAKTIPVKSLPCRPSGPARGELFSHPGAPTLEEEARHRCNCPRCPGSA